MIYAEQRGDYFPKTWNKTEFDQQFNLLMNAESFIAITEKGFIQISLLEKIGQFAKSLLGGTDYSQKQRVQGAWLKFLYYGEAQGFLIQEHIDRLQDRISYPVDYFDPAIKKISNQLTSHRLFSNPSTSDHLKNLREVVIDYHGKHSSLLAPGFWRRLFVSPLSIDAKDLKFYGETPLLLSQKAITGKVPNPYLALIYLQQAIHLKNDSPAFQSKLAEQLEKLEDSYSPELKEHMQHVQSLWITLGQTAFENHLKEEGKKYLSKALTIDSKQTQARVQIGKLYLLNKEFSLAKPFLSDLQKTFIHDLPMQLEVGDAYWQDNQYEEGLNAYETALSIYHKQPVKHVIHQRSIAAVYHRIGTSDLTETAPHRTSSQNLSYLTQAVQIDRKNEKYQDDLCHAYIQEVEISESNFTQLHGEEFLKALTLFSPTVIQKNKADILSILWTCSEHHFKASQNQDAHTFLEKALIYFNGASTKARVLELSLGYSDWSSFQPHFAGWAKEHPSDPYLKEKMGDVFWQSNKQQALKYYQESLDIFDQRLFYCTNEEDKKDYVHHIANIQARIGQTHLESKSGFWKNIPYDDAITYLEKAHALQPSRYASLLFDACVAAAQAEQKKFWPDSNKVIAYYDKAFKINAQKGNYLIELFQLCIANQQHDTAVTVYKAIKETSWAAEFKLPPDIYNEIAQMLFKKNEHEASLDCLRHAYAIDPNHQQYKQEYFQQTLDLAKKDFKKLKNNMNGEEEIIQKLNQISENLEACWKEGAESLKKMGQAYSETLLDIYQHLAHRHIQRCTLPEPANILGKELVKEHKKNHQNEMLKAISYYDKAITIQPENAALHFDKGALLDWGSIDFDLALTEFELAVKYQPRNPFYHQLMTSLYLVVYFDAEKKATHEAAVEKYGSDTFPQIYQIWSEEYMSMHGQSINPHSYTKQKGWFG